MWIKATVNLLLVVSWFSVFAGWQRVSAEPPTKRILILHTDRHLPANSLIDETIQAALREDARYRFQFYSEAIESIRIPTKRYEKEYLALLKAKYGGERIDLIFTISFPAIEFLIRHESEIFTDTPKVFISLDEERLPGLDLGGNTTGVIGTVDPAKSVELMLSIYPGTRKIVVVSGEAPRNRFMRERVRQETARFGDKVELEYPAGQTIEQLQQQLSLLPSDTLILFIAFNSDVSGRSFSNPEAVSILARDASVPMFSTYDNSIGVGAVGGHVLTFESLANSSATIGLRILGGEEPANIPPQVKEPVPIFDQRQLDKWGISVPSLPEGSIIEFASPSIWELYRGYIVAALVLIVFQSMLIMSLLVNRSRRQKAELERNEFQKLAAAEHQVLDEIVAKTPGVVWEAEIDPLTSKRRMTFVSDYVEEMLGYSVEDWLSTPSMGLSLIVEEDRPTVAAAISSIIESGVERTMSFRWEARSGGIVWVEAHFVPILNDKAQTVGLRGIAMDITERMAADEAARESEARFKIIADSAPVLIWMSDQSPLISFVNRFGTDFTGLSEEQLRGTSWLEVIHEEDRQRCVDIYTKAYERREPFSYEFRIRRADGEYLWFFSTSAPRLSTQGDFLGYVGTCVEINDRKKAEEALQFALSEISQLKNELQEENIYLKEVIKLDHDFDEIVGNSDAIKYVFFKIEQVAPTDTTVLITGETGTGKELVASAVHSMSGRKHKPMVKVNCAALSASLIESELFGHERGAFTGAASRKIGRFELADNATIFLDEVGELPLELQAKLLRLIQEGEFERLGSSKTIKADVRIIAATNRNLEKEVREGRFREDLLFRLNVFPITVPPLRERKDDIPLLVEHFASHFSKKLGKSIHTVSSATLRTFTNYDWPGNVRELANVVERASIGTSGDTLRIVEQLGRNDKVAEGSSIHTESLESVERKHITKTLRNTGWRIEGPNGAARILGLNPSTLRTRMNKLGIVKSDSRVS